MIFIDTVKPVLNGPFIKRNFVLNGNIFKSRDYHSVPRLNGNLASAEKFSGPLRFRLRQVLLYKLCSRILLEKLIVTQLVNKVQTFIEPEILLPCLQDPSGSYQER
jgi:hypothetical protein